MLFSETSDVTIVITSCGRFDLLNKTLLSLDKYIDYPIMKVIITEDSGSEAVYSIIPSSWRSNTEVIVNKVKLGQLASIDKAYELVQTEYIFHCEDDWEFYRYQFISDSLEVLKRYPNVMLVRLRSFYYDIAIDYPFHFLGKRESIKNVGFYELHSTDPLWMGFSFNPGLLRINDYKKFAPYARFQSSSEGESKLSIEITNLAMQTVLLENDACAHIGYNDHIDTDEDLKVLKRSDKKKRRQLKYIGLLILGIIIGSLI